MFAIVKIGGSQYRISPGESLTVARLEGKKGDVVTFPAMLVVDGEKNVKLGKSAAEVLVSAVIEDKLKGEKIDVARFRHKTRHRRHVGFRAQLTKITIKSIGAQGKTEVVKPAPKKRTVAPKKAA